MAYREAEATNANSVVEFESATLAMRAIYRALVEFEDTDGDGVFTDGVDKVVREQKLFFPSSKWSCLKSNEAKVAHDAAKNATVYSMSTCATSILGGDFSFCLTFHYSNTDAENEKFKVLLTPQAVKQDIEISNWPWKGKNTSLAVRLLVASATSRSVVNVGKRDEKQLAKPEDFDRVSFSGNLLLVFFGNKNKILINLISFSVSLFVFCLNEGESDAKAGFFSWSSTAFYDRNATGKTFAVKASTLAKANNDSISLNSGWFVLLA